MVTGIFFAIAAMLTWGVGDFLIQRSIRKIGNLETLASIGLFGTIALLPFAIKDFHLLANVSNLKMFGLLGVVTFLGALANFEALRKGKLSVVEVIFEVELPVTIALAFVLLGESFSLTQWLLVALAFLGIMLIAIKSLSHLRAKVERGVLIALLAALLMGGVNFLVGISSKEASPVLAVWVSWLIFTIFTLTIIVSQRGLRSLISHFQKYRWLVLLVGLFDTCAWLFYAQAVKGQAVSLTTAITESYPAVALALGVILNHERIKPIQFFGAGLALVASFFLAFSA